MKKTTLLRLGALALVLCLVMAFLLSGTLARYTTAVSGSGTATVAAWSFKANGQNAAMASVALTDTTLNSKVTGNKIAPGTDGSFKIEIDATGSDVGVDYTIAFSNLANKPTNLKFYSDASFTTEIPDITTYTGLNGSIALANVGTKVDKTVYWKWAYGAETSDNADQGKAMSFDIAVTGTQQDASVV